MRALTLLLVVAVALTALVVVQAAPEPFPYPDPVALADPAALPDPEALPILFPGRDKGAMSSAVFTAEVQTERVGRLQILDN
ncbi:hypothetical protein GWK47_002010 [Chionoecetes opilio]|uniref:Uncharacterized protein n=1 Tax=Chionoecetes opilio TaxID=41210 RepID=A0A8J5CJ03_CHIOP|nr:hypothetical protein GWK47_002010 [Chionoecetes opilio]